MLLQSTLWSLPIYYLPLFTVPVSAANLLEKIMRDFFGLSKRAIMVFIGFVGMRYVVLRLSLIHI